MFSGHNLFRGLIKRFIEMQSKVQIQTFNECLHSVSCWLLAARVCVLVMEKVV